MNNPLIQLTSDSLRTLASSLKTGVLSQGISLSALEQIAGVEGDKIAEYLDLLTKEGFAKAHIATLIETIAETKENTPYPEQIIELVLSGPDMPGIHTCDTAA
jgi:uncharacterized protein YbaP (TraB family)